MGLAIRPNADAARGGVRLRVQMDGRRNVVCLGEWLRVRSVYGTERIEAAPPVMGLRGSGSSEIRINRLVDPIWGLRSTGPITLQARLTGVLI